LSYFKTGYVFNGIKEGQWYLIIGKPKITAKKVVFSHPDLVETSSPQKNQKKTDKSDKINDLIQLLLRSSIEIHKKYGNTLSEKQYQKLLILKFDEQQIPYQKEVQIKIEES